MTEYPALLVGISNLVSRPDLIYHGAFNMTFKCINSVNTKSSNALTVNTKSSYLLNRLTIILRLSYIRKIFSSFNPLGQVCKLRGRYFKEIP